MNFHIFFVNSQTLLSLSFHHKQNLFRLLLNDPFGIFLVNCLNFSVSLIFSAGFLVRFLLNFNFIFQKYGEYLC